MTAYQGQFPNANLYPNIGQFQPYQEAYHNQPNIQGNPHPVPYQYQDQYQEFRQPPASYQQPAYQYQHQAVNQYSQEYQVDPSLTASAPPIEESATFTQSTQYNAGSSNPYQTQQSPSYSAQPYYFKAPREIPQPKFKTHPSKIWKVVSIPFRFVATLGLGALTFGFGSATTVVGSTTFLLLAAGNPSFVISGVATVGFAGATVLSGNTTLRVFLSAINDLLSFLH